MTIVCRRQFVDNEMYSTLIATYIIFSLCYLQKWKLNTLFVRWIVNLLRNKQLLPLNADRALMAAISVQIVFANFVSPKNVFISYYSSLHTKSKTKQINNETQSFVMFISLLRALPSSL